MRFFGRNTEYAQQAVSQPTALEILQMVSSRSGAFASIMVRPALLDHHNTASISSRSGAVALSMVRPALLYHHNVRPISITNNRHMASSHCFTHRRYSRDSSTRGHTVASTRGLTVAFGGGSLSHNYLPGPVSAYLSQSVLVVRNRR